MKKELTPTTTKGELLQDEWVVSEKVQTDSHMCSVPYFEISKKGDMFWIAQVNASSKLYTEEEAKATADLICQAVNERQKLLDSNRELLEIVKKLEYWHKLEDGVFTYTNPNHDGDALCFDMQDAISNAKNIQP